MKRALPLWIAAAVPAMIAGHGIAYAFSGQSTGGARHGWIQPVLELSLAVLAAMCVSLIAQTLLRAGILTHTSTERSAFALWPRLAAVQLPLYCAVELAEGSHPNAAGPIAQLVTALLAALLLAAFAELLCTCAAAAQESSRYLLRLWDRAGIFVVRCHARIAPALSVCAGVWRFQRPPPFA